MDPWSSPPLDGWDLRPAWFNLRDGFNESPDRTLFWEWRSEGTHQVAAMRGDLKLVLTGNEPPELYDVVKDPAERRNIAAVQPEIAQQLQKQIKGWLATESEEAKWGKKP